nr:MAG TPA: hypothetical protein [Caudoviricetes sp.]
MEKNQITNEKRSRYAQRYATDPEFREREKARSRKNNKRRRRDPEIRARILAYNRKHNAIPEVREKRLAQKREYNKRQYATNPEFREKLRARRQRRYERLPDPRPLPGEKQPERRVYTRSEINGVIRFLLELSPAEFMMLKLRLLHRDASPLEIAGWLKQQPGKVFKLFDDMRKKYPVLAGVLSFKQKDK